MDMRDERKEREELGIRKRGMRIKKGKNYE